MGATASVPRYEMDLALRTHTVYSSKVGFRLRLRASAGMADRPSLPSVHHANSRSSWDGPCDSEFGNRRANQLITHSTGAGRCGVYLGIQFSRKGIAFG